MYYKLECNKCICFKCKNQFKVEPRKCHISDCEWCLGEEGTYSEICKHYEHMRRFKGESN